MNGDDPGLILNVEQETVNGDDPGLSLNVEQERVNGDDPGPSLNVEQGMVNDDAGFEIRHHGDGGVKAGDVNGRDVHDHLAHGHGLVFGVAICYDFCVVVAVVYVADYDYDCGFFDEALAVHPGHEMSCARGLTVAFYRHDDVHCHPEEHACQVVSK